MALLEIDDFEALAIAVRRQAFKLSRAAVVAIAVAE